MAILGVEKEQFSHKPLFRKKEKKYLCGVSGEVFVAQDP